MRIAQWHSPPTRACRFLCEYQTPCSINRLKHGISFVSLLRQIAYIQATSTRANRSGASRNHSAHAVATRWIAALRDRYSPLPRGTTAHVLCFLFPEEDTPRKYDLQEARLASYLGECLDSSTVFSRDTKQLKSWSTECFSGCLGEELLKFAVPGTEVSLHRP